MPDQGRSAAIHKEVLWLWGDRALHIVVSKKSGAPKEGKCTAKGSKSSSDGEKAGSEEKVGYRRKRNREVRVVSRKE